ncbi:MAG: DUF2306 domain-containing protein [Cytophagales bacterium]|nr:DUF2306 domain-containing protein [Cytophagales bacterium]
MSKLSWIFFGLFAISIGLYPGIYLILDMQGGLLNTKSADLLESFWMYGFYLHIIPGGMALLVGWPQFSSRLRLKKMALHRVLGKVYLLSVTVSGLAGLYISLDATGGIIAKIGFACLALGWLFTSFMAWKRVRQGDIQGHQHWMIRSYALCFAAVTLRLWLPAFMIVGIPFLTGYVIIAWLCWVPNLIFAELVIRKQQRSKELASA